MRFNFNYSPSPKAPLSGTHWAQNPETESYQVATFAAIPNLRETLALRLTKLYDFLQSLQPTWVREGRVERR